MEKEPNEAPDGQPRAVKNLTAWIGGATAVVVALGGLAAAIKGVVHDNRSQPQAQAPTLTNEARTSNAVQPDQQSEAAPAGRENEPWYYKTSDGGTLRFEDGLWVEKGPDGAIKARYDDESGDGTMTVAKFPGGGENGEDVYLRWPPAGGRAEKSIDRQQTWNDAYTLTVDDPDRPPTAG
jgi:hypothetical protein